MNTHALRLAAVVVAMMPALLYAAVVTDIYAEVAADGSALGGVGAYDDVAGTMTYPNGFAWKDADGSSIFSGQTPPGITTRSHLVAYDGKLAAFNDSSAGRIWFFSLGQTGFSLLMEITGHVAHVQFWPSEVVLALDSSKSLGSYEFRAYDRKMAKVKWQIASLPCKFGWISSKVLVMAGCSYTTRP